jgi:hypothetical protein
MVSITGAGGAAGSSTTGSGTTSTGAATGEAGASSSSDFFGFCLRLSSTTAHPSKCGAGETSKSLSSVFSTREKGFTGYDASYSDLG